MLGCSTGGVAPSAPDTGIPDEARINDSHSLLGLWQGIIDPDVESIDLVRMRDAEMHLNALPFLEPPALVNLTLETLQFNGNIIEADIGLRHPFLGLDEFSGFDVCGIFITSGSVGGFDNGDLLMPGDGDTRLLNPDGFTRWWNPSEFPVNEGTMFSYNDGLLGTPDSVGNFTATLNGYKYFCDDLTDPDGKLSDVSLDGRGLFSAGQKNVRHYTIQMEGGLVFNYAVDACWHFPDGPGPYTAPDDFPPDANRPEAWRIQINETGNTLWNDGDGNGGELSVAINVYDWFNPDMNTVRVESPGNFEMVESAVPTGGGAGFSTYAIDITDATPAEGSIDLFISVESDSVGYGGLFPGKPVTAYFTSSAEVDDEAPVIGDGGVITFGGSGTEYILGFGVDSEGGKYSGGYFFDMANLDPEGNEPRPAQGSGGNMWMNKVSASGEYEWGYTWPTMDGYHCYIWEIVADDNDDIYVVGHFVGTIDFDPGTGVDNHTASSGSGPLDAFLMKFDSDGNYIWGESWGGPENVTAFDIVLDGNGYAYITGYFFGTADIDPTSGVDSHTASSTSGNVTDAYLIKVDTDGNYIWGATWGANATTYGFDCSVDGSGNPCATGTWQGTVYLDPGASTTPLISNGAGDTFIVRFNSSGVWQWGVGFGGDSWDQINNVVSDASGNIYATGGSASSSVDYDPGPGDMTIYGQGSYDGFLSKFDASGNFIWVKMFAEPDHDNTWDIQLDATGNIYMCGHFNGTIDLDPGPGEDLHTTIGNSDSYVVKLTSDGNFIWGTSWGGTGYENSEQVDVSFPGLVHVAGRFDSTVDFDPGAGIEERTSNGGYDTFIEMLLPTTGGW